MKKIASLLLVFAFVFGIGVMFKVQPVHAGWVNGYYRSNGTYVSGYYRSSPSYSSYKNYAPSYSNSYSYPSYSGGLKWQNGYYKPSTGTYVQGHYKTYSDGYIWNNRKNLYGW